MKTLRNGFGAALGLSVLLLGGALGGTAAADEAQCGDAVYSDMWGYRWIDWSYRWIEHAGVVGENGQTVMEMDLGGWREVSLSYFKSRSYGGQSVNYHGTYTKTQDKWRWVKTGWWPWEGQWYIDKIGPSWAQRREIAHAAWMQSGAYYDFFGDYKNPGHTRYQWWWNRWSWRWEWEGRWSCSFRCDGLVEYAYEQARMDIAWGDQWWTLCPLLQRNLMTRRD